eukprot:8756686-Pyramimonas_sp.AAC.1
MVVFPTTLSMAYHGTDTYPLLSSVLRGPITGSNAPHPSLHQRHPRLLPHPSVIPHPLVQSNSSTSATISHHVH